MWIGDLDIISEFIKYIEKKGGTLQDMELRGVVNDLTPLGKDNKAKNK